MKETKPKSILKLNLDNPLFFEIWDNPSSINSLIQTAEKITGEKIEYLFLDEVQVVDNGECDFVAKKGINYQAIQVCYVLTPENSKREFGGFTTIENDVKGCEKTIITYNQEIKDDNVTVIPAWKYFYYEK